MSATGAFVGIFLHPVRILLPDKRRRTVRDLWGQGSIRLGGTITASSTAAGLL